MKPNLKKMSTTDAIAILLVAVVIGATMGATLSLVASGGATGHD